MTIFENVVSLQRCLMINKTTKNNNKVTITLKHKEKWKQQQQMNR